MFITRFVTSLLMASALLSGCGRDQDNATVDGPEWLSAPAEPVQLQLALDSSRAVTRTISATGGNITATGSDGTRFRLRIPRDALLGDARITMIPVASVRGLPLNGGSLAAVQLEPDGLRLMQPATLSIEAEHDVPVDEQVAYGYYGDGADAHLYPLERDPQRIEMKLLHFSGYGFSRASPGDPGRKALQRAKSYEARVSAQVAETLSAERERQLRGVGDADGVVDLSAVFIEYYDAVLRPLMKTAETDERMAYCCIARYFTWLRQLALMGALGDDEGPAPEPGTREAELQRRADEAAASFVRIWRNAYEKARERELRLCREEHDFGSILRLLAIERSMQLLGGSGSGGSDIFDMEGCLNFEVEFRSIFDNRGPSGVQFYYHVTSRVPVEPPLTGAPLSEVLASAPIEYVRYDAAGTPREALLGESAGDRAGFGQVLASHQLSTRGTRPGSFRVHRVGWEWNVINSPATDCDGEDSMEERDVAEKFYVVISPGLPTEVTRHTPSGGLSAGPFDLEGNAWAWHWSQAHAHQRLAAGTGPFADDGDEPDGMYRIPLEPVRVGGVWRTDFKRADPGGDGWSLTEDGYLILRHTPK